MLPYSRDSILQNTLNCPLKLYEYILEYLNYQLKENNAIELKTGASELDGHLNLKLRLIIMVYPLLEKTNEYFFRRNNSMIFLHLKR
jgi:hypothetical protein